MTRKIAALAFAVTAALVGHAAPASAADATLVAYMTGAAERPGPGDPDGIGRAVITIDDEANQICVYTQFANVAAPLTGYHIHLAPPTSAGPVVIALAIPQSSPGQVVDCRTVENEALLDNIAANPGQYYVNLHNQEFPGGAIRGQLQPA